jgi:hypothetical protein
MTEIASKGKGTVVEVGPCPEIADGEGEVVIGRFVTARSLEVVRLTMPEGTTLTGTRVHPIWSVDRHDWVRMDELQVGEHLQTRLGPMPIASIEHFIDPQPVYNLEINGQHAYEVTELGILVHNNLLCKLRTLRGKATGTLTPAEVEELARLEALFAKQAQMKAAPAPTRLVPSSKSSWNDGHGRRLYGDLKNEFGIELPAWKTPGIQEIVTNKFSELIANGTLKLKGVAVNPHRHVYYVYEAANGYLYFVDEAGRLVSRYAPGSQNRGMTNLIW